MNVTVTEKVLRLNTVTLTGQLDAFTSPDVRRRFEEMLQGGVSNFIIDLSPTQFMDSAGMAVLVSVHKQARQQQGRVVLIWPAHEAARRVISLTRFDRVFEMAGSLAEAEEIFNL